MKVASIVLLILGVACLVIAVIYLVSPTTIGGPLEEGEMLPQYNMPGSPVSATFTKIPLGIGELVVPVFSAVVIFGLMGVALVYAGIATARRDKEAESHE